MLKLLNQKEAADFLGVSEDRLIDLIKERHIPAYMIAGRFLRFKKAELESLKALLDERRGISEERIFNKAFREVKGLERFKEVLRANDVYIIVGIAVLALLIFVFLRK